MARLVWTLNRFADRGDVTMRFASILFWSAVVAAPIPFATAAPEEKAPETGKGLKTYDGRALPGTVMGFDVGRLQMSRKSGKTYVNGIEYDKLAKDQKYLVDAVLRNNKIPNLEVGIRVWGRKPYTFAYRVVLIQDGDKVFRCGLQVLSKENVEALLPAFTAWYVQRQAQIAAAKAEARNAGLARQTRDPSYEALGIPLSRLGDMPSTVPGRERKNKCPICGGLLTRDFDSDTIHGKGYECSEGHVVVLPKGRKAKQGPTAWNRCPICGSRLTRDSDSDTIYGKGYECSEGHAVVLPKEGKGL